MVVERVVHVLYGSETGNAEEIGRRLYGELEAHDFTGGTLAAVKKGFKEIGIGNPTSDEGVALGEQLVVFVCSTTGDGDIPTNASAMVRFLRKNQPENVLKNLNYTVLGLGDTNYTNFCNGSKRLEKVLKPLGAKSIYPTGEADDEVGLELVVEPWINGLWAAMDTFFKESIGATSPVTPPPAEAPTKDAEQQKLVSDKEAELVGLPTLLTSRVTLRDSTSGSVSEAPESKDEDENIFVGHVTGAQLLTSSISERRAWHIEITCPCSLEYCPGDAFGISVRNFDTDVDDLLTILKADGERMVDVVEFGKTMIGSIKLRDVIATRCDLTSPAKKTLLRALAEHCSNPEDRYRLLKWSSKGGAEEYRREILEKNATIVEILRANPSCIPSVELLVDQLPTLQPRLYSASSAPEADGNILHFAFSVVTYNSRNAVRTGIATGQLETLCKRILEGEKSENFPLSIQKRPSGHFAPPEDLSVPYIMIGPGTGVAPFIGFLRQRKAWIERRQEGHAEAAAVSLYFGCRDRNHDYLYQDQIEGFLEERVMSELCVAFSREQEHKIYVQDRLRENGAQIVQLLENDERARIYLCGDGGGMATGVHKVLEDALVQHGQYSTADATAKLQEMALNKRLQKDVWFWG